ncbi:MAG: HD-GYP domain-containing protein [Dechloromonas sp.]|nr:HD-GYP domain-containing protein [Dechloromonas sp.]
MIKKIGIDQLLPGMFVHDLNCGWLDHPFLKSKFHVRDPATIEKIRAIGVRELYIDTIKGADVFAARTQQEVSEDLDRLLQEIAAQTDDKPIATEVREEAARARRLHGEANRLARNLMGDLRLGLPVEPERFEPIVDSLVDSIFRNSDALLPLARLKSQDSYTFEHSVGVCSLLAAFGRALQLPREEIREIALGGLLHDVGKARVDDAIVDKPGKLSDDEFALMKAHVPEGLALLRAVPNLSATALAVVAEHHERIDGSGYPAGRKGAQLSQAGQMAAIVDVYDAMTSDRVYHRGMAPTPALRKLLEWSEHHFDRALVQSFIRTLGIYPTGSLVRLDSGRLAVVVEQNERQILEPVVRVFYHAGKQYYIPPELVDLAKTQDRIASFESYEKWNIDPYKWLPA